MRRLIAAIGWMLYGYWKQPVPNKEKREANRHFIEMCCYAGMAWKHRRNLK